MAVALVAGGGRQRQWRQLQKLTHCSVGAVILLEVGNSEDDDSNGSNDNANEDDDCGGGGGHVNGALGGRSG